MDAYVPDVIEEKYARFLVRLDKCPACSRFMVTAPRGIFDDDPFPVYLPLQFSAQAKAAGFGIKSDMKAGDNFICIDCAAAGKAWFICECCKERKPSDRLQQLFGDPPDYLCTDCYETVTAKEWGRLTDALYRSHQYDFSG